MKLIAGLGNPGSRYRGTRHNVGSEVLGALAARQGVGFGRGPAAAEVARLREPGEALLARPLTFMNLSGPAVAELLRYYRLGLADLLVVVDDVHLELGRLRGRARGSAGGHNGLRSIAESLGTQEFARLRIGVGRGDERRDMADHVLSRFDPEERAEVDAAMSRAADAVELFIAEGIEPVMNRYNRREDADTDNPGAGD